MRLRFSGRCLSGLVAVIAWSLASMSFAADATYFSRGAYTLSSPETRSFSVSHRDGGFASAHLSTYVDDSERGIFTDYLTLSAHGLAGRAGTSASGWVTASNRGGNREGSALIAGNSSASAIVTDRFGIDVPGREGQRGFMRVSTSIVDVTYLGIEGAGGDAGSSITIIDADGKTVQLTGGTSEEFPFVYGQMMPVQFSSALSANGSAGTNPITGDGFIGNEWAGYSMASWKGINSVRPAMASIAADAYGFLESTEYTVSSDSGFDYRFAAEDPQVMVVPEPTSLPVMLLFGIAATVTRRPLRRR